MDENLATQWQILPAENYDYDAYSCLHVDANTPERDTQYSKASRGLVLGTSLVALCQTIVTFTSNTNKGNISTHV